MKQYTAIFLIAALLLSLAGCRGNAPAETTAATEPTQTQGTTQSPDTTGTTEPTAGKGNGAAQVLASVWQGLPEDSRFAVYGGMMANPVDSAPGDLDLSVSDEITSKYLVPAKLLAQLEEGASLVHLMNSNLFTTAAFKLKADGDSEAFAKALRENIQNNRWICGQPDRLVIARTADNYLLMAFGGEDAMELFGNSFTKSFPDAKIFYDEAIVA